MTGLKTMGNGRYKCLFCSHKSYKRMADALTHVENNHALELKDATIEEMRGTIDRLKRQPPKVVEKERVVYRDPPKEDKPKFWNVPGLYCSSCQTVQRGGGIPIGQEVSNTPHSICGNRTLMLVREFTN